MGKCSDLFWCCRRKFGAAWIIKLLSGSLCKSIFFELNLFCVNQIFTETFKPYVSKLMGNFFLVKFCEQLLQNGNYLCNFSLVFTHFYLNLDFCSACQIKKRFTLYLCLNSCRTYSLL